jgi:hypothetical protein
MSAPGRSRPSTTSPLSPGWGGETERRTNPDVASRHTCCAPAATICGGSDSTSASSRDIVRPYTSQSLPSSAAVGLISPRSSRDSVERLMPERLASSSSDQWCSTRSRASRSASLASTSTGCLISGMISQI